MREILADAWADLTGVQKLVVAATTVIVIVLALSGWIDSAASLREVKRLEREAITAKREADEKLRQAAKIAGQVREREAELNRLEGERNAQIKSVDQSRSDSAAARGNLDAARANQRTDNPDANTVCRELADLGYPCK